jgi:hypothetical protein
MKSDGHSWFPLASWLLIGAAWIWFIFALIYLTDVACPFGAVGVLGGSGLLLAVGWLFRTAAWPLPLSRVAFLCWLSVPFAGLLGCLLVLTGWGLTLRVMLSEAALSSRAASAIAEGAPDWKPSLVGLFDVDEVQVFDGGVYFYTTWSYLNRHGVARLSPGRALAPRTSVHHLYGPWYTFTWRF